MEISTVKISVRNYCIENREQNIALKMTKTKKWRNIPIDFLGENMKCVERLGFLGARAQNSYIRRCI